MFWDFVTTVTTPFNNTFSTSIFPSFGNTVVNTPFNSTFSTGISSGFGSTVTNSISNSNTNNNSSATSIFSTVNTANGNSSTTTIIDESYSDIYLDNPAQDILTGFTENEPPITNNNFDPITGEIVVPDLTQDEPLIPDTSNQEAPIHSF
ncbi:MAG: hypothetical protein F6K39_19350, partial [Okeania sp. SIO3B3]|nr:hypothetical protein [Okeania sp. SIO3B3]